MEGFNQRGNVIGLNFNEGHSGCWVEKTRESVKKRLSGSRREGMVTLARVTVGQVLIVVSFRM